MMCALQSFLLVRALYKAAQRVYLLPALEVDLSGITIISPIRPSYAHFTTKFTFLRKIVLISQLHFRYFRACDSNFFLRRLFTFYLFFSTYIYISFIEELCSSILDKNFLQLDEENLIPEHLHKPGNQTRPTRQSTAKIVNLIILYSYLSYPLHRIDYGSEKLCFP